MAAKKKGAIWFQLQLGLGLVGIGIPLILIIKDKNLREYGKVVIGDATVCLNRKLTWIRENVLRSNRIENAPSSG